MYFKDGGYILGTLRCSLGTERVCKKVITASRKALKTHPSQRQVASLKTPCNGHAGLLTDKRWRRRATAVGFAVVRVLPMTCRNSATLRLRQSSGVSLVPRGGDAPNSHG